MAGTRSSSPLILAIALCLLAITPAPANARSRPHPFPRAHCATFQAAELNDEGAVIGYTPVRVETFGPRLTCGTALAVVKSFWNPEEELIVHEPEPPNIETTYGLKNWPGWTCRVAGVVRSHGNSGECRRRGRTALFYFGGT